IADVANCLAGMSERRVEVIYTGLRPGEKLHAALLGSDEVDARSVHSFISHVQVQSLEPDAAWIFEVFAGLSYDTDAMRSLVEVALAPGMTADSRVALAVAAGAFGCIGFVEDIVGIRPLLRLGLQIVAAGLALPWLLAGLHGNAVWQAAFVAGTVLWLVAYTN